MGTDIDTSSGVLVDPHDMLNMINRKTKPAIIKACEDFYHGVDDSYADVKKFFSDLEEIESKIKIDDLKQLLYELIEVKGDTAKYSSDCHIPFDGWIRELWENILDVVAPSLPELLSLAVWGSRRDNGYDVPIGEARFVFNNEDCYTRKLSKEGSALEKIVGPIYVSEWTEVSY